MTGSKFVRMCGVVGIMRLGSPASNEELLATTRAATTTIAHRGPDDVGTWNDEKGIVFLGHRRLAVVDLSPNGHQPMQSRSGRWTISYNGEIYNHRQLLDTLGLGPGQLRGTSDTEVIVEALQRWGFEATLRRLNGMFAIAAWDDQEQRLWLARDRFGEKPLYYAQSAGLLLFGSELRAIRSALDADPPIDRQSLDQLFRYGYIPAPHSIYEGVQKLRAGHLLCALPDDRRVETREYWSALTTARETKRRNLTLDESTDELDDILSLVVGSRMESDVPLGAFLSGGIDSSLIVAMMAKRASAEVRTFTIGFEESEYDESPFARRVAQVLGTNHSETILGASDALAVVPNLPSIYDEPFADSSQIPTWLICNETRRQVTVALSGDGGDELFGGYDRYRVKRRFEQQFRLLPGPARRLGSHLLSAPSPAFWAHISRGPMARLLPAIGRKRTAEKAIKLSSMLKADKSDIYERLHTANVGQIVEMGGSTPRRPGLYRTDDRKSSGDSAEVAMALDTTWYLPEDLLTKVDRASMSVSLEVRAPFLDPELFAFAWSIPRDQRIGESSGKVVLKNLLRRYLPNDLIDRPKTGFGAPVGRWLREDLRPWADDLLSPATLTSGGLIDSNTVSSLWDLHLQGELDLSSQLWPILVFQAWGQK